MLIHKIQSLSEHLAFYLPLGFQAIGTLSFRDQIALPFETNYCVIFHLTSRPQSKKRHNQVVTD